MGTPCTHDEDFGRIKARFDAGDKQFDDITFIKRSVMCGGLLNLIALIWFAATAYTQLNAVTDMVRDMYPKVNKLVYIHEKEGKL